MVFLGAGRTFCCAVGLVPELIRSPAFRCISEDAGQSTLVESLVAAERVSRHWLTYALQPEPIIGSCLRFLSRCNANLRDNLSTFTRFPPTPNSRIGRSPAQARLLFRSLINRSLVISMR